MSEQNRKKKIRKNNLEDCNENDINLENLAHIYLLQHIYFLRHTET